MKNAEEKRALSLKPMSRGMQIFAAAVFLLVGAGLAAFLLMNPLGFAFLPGGETAPEEPGERVHQEPGPEHSALYTCPMHPDVIEAEPGDCPLCGMSLVEVVRTGEADEGIRIDPVQVQNMGVVSVEARTGSIARSTRTVGILDFNADRVTWVNTKFSGWIEKVHVIYVGQHVSQGDPLFEVYSPELVTTQEEYLRALEYRSSMEGSARAEALRQAESLLESTRSRLRHWDISEEQIRHLEETREVQRRLTVESPAEGVVAEVMKQALEGLFVEPGMNLYRIADLSSIWAHVEVHESDLAWIREGQPAEVSFKFEPGGARTGKVLFLYPEVSEETRTLKICVEVPNRDRKLRPGMFADVVVQGPPIRGAVLIPNSAVLRSGERNLVFVDQGEGRFQPREVILGLRGQGDSVQVLEGVQPGEAVVTQAQFMLDSESRIQEGIAKFMTRKRAGEMEP